MCGCGQYGCPRCGWPRKSLDRGSRARAARDLNPITDVKPEHLDEAVYKFLPADRVEDFYKFLHNKQNPKKIYTAKDLYTLPRRNLGKTIRSTDGYISGVLNDMSEVVARPDDDRTIMLVVDTSLKLVHPWREFTLED